MKKFIAILLICQMMMISVFPALASVATPSGADSQTEDASYLEAELRILHNETCGGKDVLFLQVNSLTALSADAPIGVSADKAVRIVSCYFAFGNMSLASKTALKVSIS